VGDKNDLPPALMLRQLAFVMRASRALYAGTQLGIADILADGPMTSRAIAAQAGTDGPTMRRLLRALVAHGVFEEESPDLFRLNPAGKLLQKDAPGSQRAGVLFTAGDLRWQLWSDFLESARTGQVVVERAFGKSIFRRFEENAEEGELFNDAMTSYSAALSGPVIAVYDFSRAGLIADIGGGNGRFLADILIANPKAQGILFDLATVAAGAKLLLDAGAAAGRAVVVSGTFFEGIPSGADVYLLKNVIHDWDDARAVEILRNCRKAMGADAKLLVVERVMPERAERGQAAEAYLLDLEMLVHTPGGRERTEAEFDAILTEAGLRLTRIIRTTAPVSLIEARTTRDEAGS
jgi:hypothetical protein